MNNRVNNKELLVDHFNVFLVNLIFQFDFIFYLLAEPRSVLVIKCYYLIWDEIWKMLINVELKRLAYSFIVKLVKDPWQLNWLMALFIEGCVPLLTKRFYWFMKVRSMQEELFLRIWVGSSINCWSP